MRGEFEAEFAVPPEAVWAELVGPGARSWYYRLRAEGDFAPGGELRWLDDEGTVAEEARVLEVDPLRRLVLESRFVFVPAYAQAPPHRVVWELAPAGAGTRVRMTSEGDGAGAQLLATEGGAQLQGLRLVLDPAAQAEIARRDDIGQVTVRDVAPDRLADYQSFFDHDAFRDYPAWQACYCMAPLWDGTDEEWNARTGGENRADVSGRIERGELTALLAYADGQPAGWCHYGPTTRLAGIRRRFGLEPDAEDRIGSLACFIVAAPYRGHGVARRLLEAALDRMRDRGLAVAEAYPAASGDLPQDNWRGPLAMYLAAGFTPHREAGRTLIVRRPL